MRVALFTVFTFITFFINAQTTFTYTGTGDWTDQSNWSPSYPGITINSGDKAIISAGVEVIVSGQTRITINGTLTNEGTIINNAQLIINSTFVNNSILQNNGTFETNGFLYGNNISHTNDFELSGFFSPGNIAASEVGTYIFDNNVTFLGSTSLTSEILNISEADLVDIAGNISLSGSLIVKLLDDYDPAIGTAYTILTANNITGTFNGLNFPDLGMGKEFEVSYTTTSVVLTVVRTFTYTGIGDWTDQANWSPSYPGLTIDSGNKAIISAGAEVIVSGQTRITINGTLTNEGTLTAKTFRITNNGTIVNRNTMDAKFINDSTLTNEGTLTLGSGSTNNGTLVNENTLNTGSNCINEGTLTNRRTLICFSSFVNNGIVVNENTIINAATFINEGTIINNVQLTNNSIFVNNSILQNNGTFETNGFFYGNNISHTNDYESSGLFSPGGSTGPPAIGTYIFDNNVTFTNQSGLTSEIFSISEVDLVDIAGTASLSGNFTVRLLGDYDPALGTTYTILTANNITGTFNLLNFPDLGVDKEFKINYNSNSIVLEVIDSNILDIVDLDADHIKIVMYPNPVKDILYIDGLRTSEKVDIYSVLGAKLQESEISPLENKILLDNLSKGSYFLSIGNISYRFIKN